MSRLSWPSSCARSTNLAGMLVQPGKCESMTQIVGGNLGASQGGPPDQGGDGILN